MHVLIMSGSDPLFIFEWPGDKSIFIKVGVSFFIISVLHDVYL